jgi:ribosome-associated protein
VHVRGAGTCRGHYRIGKAADFEYTSGQRMRSDERSPRQISRSQTKKAGDRSAKLARILMEMKPATLAKLELDDELREAIDRARQVETMQARRRAERALAGDLRGIDLVELTSKIETVGTGNDPGVQFFHMVERWRDRLLSKEDGAAALKEFPVQDAEMLRLLDAAVRERDTGKPPGAARKLFRHLSSLLREDKAEAAESDESDEA